MAVNFATGLSLWHNDLYSALWDLNTGRQQFSYIYHSDPQNVRTNKNFSIKSLNTNLTLHISFVLKLMRPDLQYCQLAQLHLLEPKYKKWLPSVTDLHISTVWAKKLQVKTGQHCMSPPAHLGARATFDVRHRLASILTRCHSSYFCLWVADRETKSNKSIKLPM